MSILLAILLGWDQPYPPPGGIAADGVRCYVSISPYAWSSYDTAPLSGPCHPDAVIAAAPLGAVDFMVRGHNAAGESGNSNTWRLCSFEVREGVPASLPGIQVWNWIDGEGVEQSDRSELIACIQGAPV